MTSLRPRRRRLARSAAVALAAAFALAPGLGAPVPAAAQRAAAGQGVLALEPIGGFTSLGNVRILTTSLCPARSTSLIVRITGGGFKPDTNVMGNTAISLVPKTPDGRGYVAPIFADWDYLASAHDAKLPLNGPATLTLLCADIDLERIDARMEGAVTFSAAGTRPTYLQKGGPRLATGLPGIPAPGNGGVPKDAPTAPPVTTNAAGQYLPGQAVAIGAGDGQSGAAPDAAAPVRSGVGQGVDASDSGAGSSSQDQEAASATADPDGGGGTSTGLLLAVGFSAALLAFGAYVFTRRPRPDVNSYF